MMRKVFGAAAVAILLLFAAGAQAQGEDNLLPVEQAFALRARVATPGTLVLDWTIAPHYYLYRGRIKIESLTSAVALGKPALPDGLKEHDPYLGDVEIYHDALHATVPYSSHGADMLKLKVRFQGCHEIDPKICYPPHTQIFELALPAAASATAPSSSPLDANGGSSLAARLGALGQAPTALSAGDSDEPLPPDQAYRFDAIAAGPTTLLLRWVMPKGYYLYRDQFHFELQNAAGITLGTPQWPQGVQHADAYFGTTEVYFGELDLTVPIHRSVGAPRTITVQASYRGCKEGSICYPTITRTREVALPAASAAQLAAQAPVAEASSADAAITDGTAPRSGGLNADSDRLSRIVSGASLWLILGAFFVAGLGLAFTPCVYPMLPILTGIIAGAGEHLSTGRALVLSLVYILANAVVFAIAGIIAGLAGFNVSAWFQQPWLLSLFALLFVLLALGMFGFYELQLPASWQAKIAGISNRQKAGSLLGVAIMGALSALIVGPCVTPALAVAIGTIGQTGSPLLGGSALFALGLGMGAPLVVFGTFEGKFLPRAGGWMDAVKAVFGVAFLGIAIWMLSRFLDPLWIMLMIGALAIACAVYMGALDRLPEGASGWRKLWKALGIFVLIIGAVELIGAAAGSRAILQPLHGLRAGNGATAEAPAGLDFARIKTSADLDRAIATASAAGKPLLLDFYADWCVACKEMEAKTFTQPEVQQALSGFVLVQADVTANDAADQALLKRFSLYGPPATIFFGADGKPQRNARLIGYEPAAAFVRRVNSVAEAP